MKSAVGPIADLYLFGQDERVFAFETFRRWLRNHFFCNSADYTGVTGLNRHMFAHGTVSTWHKQTNFTRLIVALPTLAAVESWYDASYHISFLLPDMSDDNKLLWQQARLRADVQMTMLRIEQDAYQKNGGLSARPPNRQWRAPAQGGVERRLYARPRAPPPRCRMEFDHRGARRFRAVHDGYSIAR
jgi:hypothetical protein